jgi:hypothetical protein
MQIEMMSTDRLVPYVRNARTHSAHQVAQIAASIAAFGFINPILIGADDVIIAGHGRLMAAKSLGLPEVPVMVVEHLDDVYRRGLALADNRTAEGAAWNEQLLALELGALRDADFDTEVTGFSDIEIEDLFAGLDHLGDVGFGVGSGPSGDGNATHGSGAAEPPPVANASLAERFGIPPFSILDARKGWWQDRKRAWIDLGIRSELGRGEGDRACPGGSPMPGNGSRKDYKPGAAKAFHDGAVLGKGGLSDQVAAAATARRAGKAVAHG